MKSSRVTVEDGWFSIEDLDFRLEPDGSLTVAACGEYDWVLTPEEVQRLIGFIGG